MTAAACSCSSLKDDMQCSPAHVGDPLRLRAPHERDPTGDRTQHDHAGLLDLVREHVGPQR